MRTDVNACDHTWECMDTVRESALKVDSTRKIPCCIRESNLRQQRAVQCSTNWATSPPCKSCKVACDDIVSCPGMICLFGLLPTVCTCIFYCFFFFLYGHIAPQLWLEMMCQRNVTIIIISGWTINPSSQPHIADFLLNWCCPVSGAFGIFCAPLWEQQATGPSCDQCQWPNQRRARCDSWRCGAGAGLWSVPSPHQVAEMSGKQNMYMNL